MNESTDKVRSTGLVADVESNQHDPIISSKNAAASTTISNHPFFYFQNATQSQTSNYFSLHSHPNSTTTTTELYSRYGTTVTIIILLHIIYFLQWNVRRSRKELCTNYEQLVEKKQFYKAAIAIASHPPVDGGERNANNLDDIDLHRATVDNYGETGSRSWVSVGALLSRRCSLLQRISSISQRNCSLVYLIHRSILQPFINGCLSGLPLLTFTSHIFWQCRALEEFYDVYDGKLVLGVNADINLTKFAELSTVATEVLNVEDISDEDHAYIHSGYTYLRVLVALAFTSILLELILLRLTMKRNEFGPHQHRRERAMCTTASLSTAVLGVYNSRFPFAPPPLLPFIRVSFLSASGFSFLFSILILTVLTRKMHLMTSIFGGMLSGSLWSMGLTSFLGTRYWGNAVLFGLAMAFLLSLKAQPLYSKYLAMVVPCIDYVAWNGHGKIPSANNDAHDGDVEMGAHTQAQNGDHHSQERLPLLMTQSSSVSDGSGIAIRGRVPMINSMESDLSGAEDLIDNNDVAMPSASPRFGTSVLRRAGGAGNE